MILKITSSKRARQQRTSEQRSMGSQWCPHPKPYISQASPAGGMGTALQLMQVESVASATASRLKQKACHPTCMSSAADATKPMWEGPESPSPETMLSIAWTTAKNACACFQGILQQMRGTPPRPEGPRRAGRARQGLKLLWPPSTPWRPPSRSARSATAAPSRPAACRSRSRRAPPRCCSASARPPPAGRAPG